MLSLSVEGERTSLPFLCSLKNPERRREDGRRETDLCSPAQRAQGLTEGRQKEAEERKRESGERVAGQGESWRDSRVHWMYRKNDEG